MVYLTLVGIFTMSKSGFGVILVVPSCILIVNFKCLGKDNRGLPNCAEIHLGFLSGVKNSAANIYI